MMEPFVPGKRITSPPRTLPDQLNEFPLPVFDPRQVPFSPTSPGKRSPGRPRTMKEYEEDFEVLRKENFDLKVRIFFLEQHHLDPSLPKDVQELRHQYTNLRVEHEVLKKDLDTKENLLLDTYKALDALKQELESVKEEKQELQCKIETLEKELKDYHVRFMETSVPQLDDTNAFYSALTFGYNSKAGPSRKDPLAEEKIKELQEDLAREKERCVMLEEELSVLNEKKNDDQMNAQKLTLQVQEMEENLKKILLERDRYEELYSSTSTLTSKLDRSLRKKMDAVKEKDAEVEKYKSLAEELRRQLTRVENQLQEIQERSNRSQSEKHVRLLYSENEKLKHEVKYLQEQIEKRTSRTRTSSTNQDLKEAQERHEELVKEIQALQSKDRKCHRLMQSLCAENKKLKIQLHESKGNLHKLSTNSSESTKEEVPLDNF